LRVVPRIVMIVFLTRVRDLGICLSELIRWTIRVNESRADIGLPPEFALMQSARLAKILTCHLWHIVTVHYTCQRRSDGRVPGVFALMVQPL
jgi:hypothetical protein